MAMVGSSQTDHIHSQDFLRKPPSNTFHATPPRALSEQIYFVKMLFSDQVTTNTTTIVENNLSFTYASTNSPGTLITWFDQYFLAEAWMTIANNSNNIQTGVTVTLPQVYTALDWDNTTNLNSVTTLAQFNSCECDVLGPGNSLTRYIQPASVVNVGVSAGGGNSATSRLWSDCANPNVVFNGFRCIVQNTPAAALSLDRTTTLIWAFRTAV
jgi:hypothetical protein